jgi:hypothetical protein
VNRTLRRVVASGVIAFALPACGGSGSETPPPLEPLPVNLHYDRSSTALAGEHTLLEADAGAVVKSSDPIEEPVEAPPARSTWGGSKDAPAPSIK